MIDIAQLDNIELLDKMEPLSDPILLEREEEAELENEKRSISQQASENFPGRVSHRKIKTVTYTIVHDNGDVCPRTYNQPCAHDDEHDHDDLEIIEGNFLSIRVSSNCKYIILNASSCFYCTLENIALFYVRYKP